MGGPLSNGNGVNGTNRALQFIDWGVRIALVAGIAFGWDVGLRLTRIETQLDQSLPEAAKMRAFMEQGPRFTAKDASDLEDGIKEWVDARIYPEWLRSDLNEIKSGVKILPAIESRLSALETRVQALEKK